MKNLVLYVETGCPYVAKVKKFAEKYGIEFLERNIADPDVAADLIERGGKRQVPYLVDVDNVVEMYESDDIIDYLRERPEGEPIHVTGTD